MAKSRDPLSSTTVAVTDPLNPMLTLQMVLSIFVRVTVGRLLRSWRKIAISFEQPVVLSMATTVYIIFPSNSIAISLSEPVTVAMRLVGSVKSTSSYHS